jgi:3-isopropylmalate dehydratase small subunit
MSKNKSSVYLTSPATVALSAIYGRIASPAVNRDKTRYPYHIGQSATITIPDSDNRYNGGVWNYKDADNLNTDQMFAGNLTYEINSSQPDKIVPHLMKGFDGHFADKAQKGDIMVCGENLGCGSSREHPAVGLAYLGISAILVKSVSRIFFRSAINQGLPILVVPEAVDAYRQGDLVKPDMKRGLIRIAEKDFAFSPLPEKLRHILEMGGLLKAIINAN